MLSTEGTPTTQTSKSCFACANKPFLIVLLVLAATKNMSNHKGVIVK
jgi:hypothetical protein